MFKNFFKTSVRNLSRNINYTLLNILGLAAGIGIGLLIFLFIRFETSYDGFHAKKDRIYRVLTEYRHGDIFYGAGVPLPLPSTVRSDFPQLEAVTGIFASSNDNVFVMENGQIVKKFKEKTGVFSIDPDFFTMFDFKWLAGDPKTSLKDPQSAVLSRATAEKYFGHWEDALGKTINLNNYVNAKITGILENPPANTDFQIKIATPYSMLGYSRNADWNTSSDRHGCYVLLPPGESEASFTRQLRAFAKKYGPEENKDEFVLQHVSKVHLYDSKSRISNFLGRTISPELINALWIVAAFILFIACVNFINLSTAQAVNRAREIGMRKVLGSTAWQIRMQFLLETFLIVLMAVIIGLIAVLVVVTPLGRMLDMPLSIGALFNWRVALFLVGTALVVTLLAGFYPSEIISRFNPVTALKSKYMARSKKGVSLRRGLVVFQFIIAQALIIAMLIMIRQIEFFRNAPMGFEKEAIVTVSLPPDNMAFQKIDLLRNRLKTIPGIKEVSFNSNPPASNENNWSDFQYDNSDKAKNLWAISKFADPDYLKLYNIQLVAGRNLSSDTAHEFLVSEKMLEMLGISDPQTVINKQMALGGDWVKGRIVGVLKDFHTTGFKDKFSPVFIVSFKPAYNSAAIKLNSAQAAPTLRAVENLWNTTFPNFVHEYQFLDTAIENFYKQEIQQTQIYKILAGIAILLSCLGLYGLVSFMAVQRIKEVGIRKVLGASPVNIVYMFLREFMVLIGIAFLIASPLAWYFMNSWLENYAFRINITWWIFIAGALISLIIVLLTTSFNAIRAAFASPVKNLRSE